MPSQTKLITPSLARHILDKYTGAKKIKLHPHKVERLAKLIVNGRWDSEIYGISFRSNDILKSGHESLAACVQVNQPIKVDVSYYGRLWDEVEKSHGDPTS